MQFINEETGAVTVDWVVLTAALVGLGLATMGVVSSGVEDVSGDIEAQLSNTTITSEFDSHRFAELFGSMGAMFASGSARYEMMAIGHGASQPSGTGHQDDFAQVVAGLRAKSDADMIADIQARGVHDPDRIAKLGQLEAMPTTGLTAADLHPYASGLDEAGAQALIDSDFGGDANAFREYLVAETEFGVTLSDTQKALADERGLTY